MTDPKRILGVFSDEVEAAVELDDVSGALVAIDFAHHMLHEGRHFTFSAISNALNNGQVREFLIVAPDTDVLVHLAIRAFGALHTQFDIFEDCTHANGTAQTVFNNNRRSTRTAGAKVYANGGTGADGTVIFRTSFGIDTGDGSHARSGGGEARGDSEWVLKKGGKYLIRLTSLTDANVVSMVWSWYELAAAVHTPAS